MSCLKDKFPVYKFSLQGTGKLNTIIRSGQYETPRGCINEDESNSIEYVIVAFCIFCDTFGRKYCCSNFRQAPFIYQKPENAQLCGRKSYYVRVLATRLQKMTLLLHLRCVTLRFCARGV